MQDKSDTSYVIECAAASDLEDTALAALIRERLANRGLIVLRGMGTLSDEMLTRFIRHFGDPYSPSKTRTGNGLDVVTISAEEPGEEAAAAKWHLDFSFLPSPAKETILYCIDPSDHDVKTHFCNMYDIFDDLDGEIGDIVRHKKALYAWLSSEEHENSHFEGSEIDCAVHPLVFTHPQYHREVLYYCDLKLRRILDVPPEVERSVRAAVRSALNSGRHRYSHSWKKGDLVFFDAIGMAHRRDPISDDSLRHLKGFFTRFDFQTV